GARGWSSGILVFIGGGPIWGTFSARFELPPLAQPAGGAAQLPPIPWTSAETHEPISPTTGAAISTLESISFGSMSIWMNFFGASPQVLPLPCDRSQFRQAPISLPTSE